MNIGSTHAITGKFETEALSVVCLQTAPISAQTMDTVLSAALNRPAEASPTILTELPGDVRTRVRKPGLRQ